MRAARVVPPAVSYWAGVFALGIVLGSARVLWLAPAIGETAAVLAELPPMLAASWWLARRLVAGRALSPAEALLAVALGQSVGDWLAAVARPAGLAGLAGQLGFAAMPAWVRRER